MSLSLHTLLLINFGTMIYCNQKEDDNFNSHGLLKKLLPLRLRKDPYPDHQLRIKLIILFCRYRSGSTFLGEIFNQNPSVMYDFESLHPSPLKNLPININESQSEKDIKTHYLQHILRNCSFNYNAFGQTLNRFYR